MEQKVPNLFCPKYPTCWNFYIFNFGT